MEIAGEAGPSLPPVGYVMRSRPSATVWEEIEAGLQPRPEYFVFLRRHPQTIVLDASLSEQATSPLARLLHRRGQNVWALAATALSYRPRPALFLTTGEDVGLPLAMLARLSGDRRPVYIITHGSFLASGKFRVLMRLLRHLPAIHFLCLSETLRQRMVNEFGVPPPRAHNTSYATDLAFFDPLRTDGADVAHDETGAPLVAAVGAASRDYRTLVRATADLGGQLRLQIAADSAWFRMSVDVAGEDLPPHIQLVSYPYSQLRALYASARFVVVPLYEGRHACGYSAIIEAMAMGKAVVATRTENYSDFISEGETGLYVPPGDVGAMRAAVLRLLDDPPLARRMGQAARQRAAALFTEEAYVRRIERALGGGSPTAL